MMNIFHNKESDDLVTKEDHKILRISISSPGAFSLIVDRYQQPFLKKVRTIIRNSEDAEDIVQEVFVKIYLNASKFKLEQGATFKSWAYKILLNTAFTYYGKRKRSRAFLEVTTNDLLETMTIEDKDWVKKIRTDRFISVISKIPVHFARLLTKLVIDGKSDKDVAREEGISEGALRTRLHRAKAEFQKINISL
jgi:RNA polymerase sigma-70 factor (ECF subfamily)